MIGILIGVFFILIAALLEKLDAPVFPSFLVGIIIGITTMILIMELS